MPISESEKRIVSLVVNPHISLNNLAKKIVLLIVKLHFSDFFGDPESGRNEILRQCILPKWCFPDDGFYSVLPGLASG